jgi:hypothetical protein
VIFSEAVLVALIVGIPATLGAIGAIIIGIRTTRKIELVHKATNSMKDALVAVTEKEALARGKKEGRAERD